MRTVLLVISIGLVACGGSSPTEPGPGSPSPPTGPGAVGVSRVLSMVSGSDQEGAAGRPLVQPLVVLVTDLQGRPLGGVDVLWEVSLGSGEVDAPLVAIDGEPGGRAVATTGGDGLVTVDFVPSLGQNRVLASSFFAREVVVFEVTGLRR